MMAAMSNNCYLQEFIEFCPTVAKFFLREFKKTADKLNLSLPCANVLIWLLSYQKEFAQNEIVELFKVHPCIVSRLIDGMEKKKLIKRFVNKNDRRENLIVLTDIGKKNAKELELANRGIYERILSPLNREEIEYLLKIIRKMEVMR
ncbi:MAG: MarR family transcriptional regulator [Christensenellaceae bacterium]|jgi:DNA-binding MarR family transcriptional regulator|nr:MarR family transcriptional regulator [Christensenellaceae bacterium]